MEHNGDVNATKDNSIITLVLMTAIMVVVFNSYGGKVTGTDYLTEQSKNASTVGDNVVYMSSETRCGMGRTYPESMQYDYD